MIAAIYARKSAEQNGVRRVSAAARVVLLIAVTAAVASKAMSEW